MSRLTSVGSRRVLERVIVVKSEKRTLIEMVRPTIPAARTRAAVRSLSLSSSRWMYAGSSTSKENVSSAPMLRSRRMGITGRESCPQASAYRAGPALSPRALRNVSTGVWAMSATVRRPRRCKTSSVRSPTPHSAPTGSWCRKPTTSASDTTSSPSGLAKPDGLLVVSEAEVVGFLHQLPVGALWGVGDRTEEVLQRLGLRTVADIAHTPVDTLRRALGDNAGPALYALAWGHDSRPVMPIRRERSIGADETFSFDVDDPAYIHRELLKLSDRTACLLYTS